MRILLITPYFYPHVGGSQQYALELYRHLMRIDKTIAVDVICYNTTRSPKVEKYKKFTIYRIPALDILNGQFAIPNYIELWRLLRRLKTTYSYKIVNSHTRFFENSWWAPLAAKFFHAKAVLTDHASSSPIHASPVITLFSRIIEQITTRITLPFYDLITVTNKATKRYIQSFGIRKPILIYGGIDTDLYRLKQKNCKRKIPKMTSKVFNKEDVLITFLGRMIPTKGPGLFLEAAKKLSRIFPHAYFVFAGGGEMYEKLRKEKSSQIMFLNELNRKQVVQLLAYSDVLVNPSVHFEGFPNVLLEAGASGCAVIATDNGGTKELIINGKTGIIVKPEVEHIKDAIRTLVNNKTKRIVLSRQLRKRIEKDFTWKRIAKFYHKIVCTLAADKEKIVR